MGRHDFAPDEAGGPVDLAAIVADDALLDALGRHHRPAPSGSGSTAVAAPRADALVDGPIDVRIGVPVDPPIDAPIDAAVATGQLPPGPAEPELIDLFATWRAAIDADPVPEPPTVDSVVVAMRSAGRRRSLRPMLGVVAAICGLLISSAAIGARTARPGDVLWPVTQVLWSDRAESVVAGDTTRVALGQARMALDAGLTSEARSALVVASTVLPRVAERDGRQNLKADLDNLWSTLDWVQQQHATPADAPAAVAPSPTPERDIESSAGTGPKSAPADSGSASSSRPPTSTGSDPTSSQPTAPSTGTPAGPSTPPPASSAPLPPAPPPSVLPPAISIPTAPTTPTAPITPTAPTPPPTEPIEPTEPSTSTPPVSPTPSEPSSPATPTGTEPSTPSTPSEPPATATSATQQALPVVPTGTAGDATVARIGEQSIDPAQQGQQEAQQTAAGDG